MGAILSLRNLKYLILTYPINTTCDLHNKVKDQLTLNRSPIDTMV